MAILSRDFRATPNQLRAAIRHALDLLAARDIVWSNGDRNVTAKLPMNFWSFGERLNIAITDNSRVSISSACAWPAQVVDWGKNQKNCEILFQHIAEFLGEGRIVPPAHPGTPVLNSGFTCPGCGTDLPPFVEAKVTAVGWVLTVVLLFAFFPLFWLGLLVKQKRFVCSNCGRQIAG
ncbi:MAG: hypothetical protein NT031_13460 [Planctomycetota bacterium]|nr:hypothetical protein [Planctomycetota bacterium]